MNAHKFLLLLRYFLLLICIQYIYALLFEIHLLVICSCSIFLSLCAVACWLQSQINSLILADVSIIKFLPPFQLHTVPLSQFRETFCCRLLLFNLFSLLHNFCADVFNFQFCFFFYIFVMFVFAAAVNIFVFWFINSSIIHNVIIFFAVVVGGISNKQPKEQSKTMRELTHRPICLRNNIKYFNRILSSGFCCILMCINFTLLL